MPDVYISGDGTYWVDPYTGEKTKIGGIDLTKEPGYVHQSSSKSSSSSNNTSTSYSFADPKQLAIEADRVQNEITKTQNDYAVAVRNGDRQGQQYATTRLDDLAKYHQTLTYNYAQLQQTGQIAAANEAGQNTRNAAAIAGTAANTATTEAGQNARLAESLGATAANEGATRGYNAWQLGQTQGFTAHENALSAAQKAGEFAATYSIQKAQQQTADQQAKISAAKTFSDLSGSADLTGYGRFLAAGGGDAGNAIMRGASSLTRPGQLGAARALQASEAPLPTYADAPAVPTVAPWAAGMWSEPARPVLAPAAVATTAAPVTAAPTAPTAAPTAGAAPAPPDQRVYANNNAGEAAFLTANPTNASAATLVAALNSGPRYAMGTRGQLGVRPNVLGRRVGPADPMAPPTNDPNAGIPQYAHGTFIAGDSTGADPTAGGAHPEDITLGKDADDQPEASVTPLTQPGIGDTEGEDGGDKAAMLGALLEAIGRFLQASETQAPPAPQGGRLALGTMGRPQLARRYALGTDPTMDGAVSPADDPYVDRVMAMRQSTPFDANPFSSQYQFSDPTQQKINSAALQTRTGVPGTTLDYLAQRYQPGGLARGSHYSREQTEGI